MNVNTFKAGNNSSKPTSTILFDQYLQNVKNGEWQDDVLAYRNGNLEKVKLPCITTSGTFSNRAESGLVEHSGFMCIDLDAKDQVVTFDIEEIKKDQYVYAVHRSVSGFGYAVFFKINPDKHKESYFGLEKYFLEKYKLVADPAPKNVASLRFVSYDPDLFINEKAKTFKQYVKKEKKPEQFSYYPTTQNDFDDIVREVTNKGLNLCDDYDVWVKFAFALSKEFGENGRSYFHAFSCTSSKYDYAKTDKMFDIASKRNGSGVGIATVYYHCKQAGINIVSEKTKQIAQVAKLSKTKEEAKITLKELGIEDDGLVDKIKQDEERTSLDDVVDLIKISKIKFNEITRNYEFGKEQMTDRVLANFYAKCWKLIDADLSKDKIFTLIENPDNTTSYNPIRDFFAKNSNLKVKGNFEKLCTCFEIKHEVNIDGKKMYITDYLQTYLKKWLISIVASAHGTYSLMILVLNGKQGINKTLFFRELLPQELRDYYAESSLDDGKDSEILMTKKLLIVDDEFGGKSKNDSKKLKNISSKQTFSIRRPYGKVSEDLERIAVMAGTTNEAEIINDYTGNRRIIPVNVVSFDIDKYRSIDKTALFIELYQEWQKDRTGWFLTPEEIDNLNLATIKNQEVMSEQELISDLMIGNEYSEMTNTQIKLQLEQRFNSFRTSTKRIGQALKILGYEPQLKCIDGKTQRVYNVAFK
jgi:predicted P-loop ATPase